MLLAEKMGLEDFQYKYLGLLDFLGGGGIFSSISALMLRQKVRERYGISGSTGGDFMIAFCCCTPCSICQMTKEVEENSK
jgi:Cys-rich protein (TIGR01571 family)